MLTILCYIALTAKFGMGWSGWILVLPVLTDLVIIDKIGSCK
jgi:hypothetical protein